MSAVLLLVAAVMLAAVASAEPWPYPYTGRILPPPQRVQYGTGEWEVARVGQGSASVVIIISPQASTAERLAAQELVERIAALSEGARARIVTSPEDIGRVAVMVALGAATSGGLPAEHAPAARGVGFEQPQEPEGYSIAFRRHRDGRVGILALGADPVGAYWASKTLQQLIERRGDRVLIHEATVHDWPVFRLRSFKAGGQDWEALRRLGEWCPNAKFNCYNICYTTLGADQWPHPSQQYIDFAREMTAFMRDRGLDCMPFVNPYYLWKEHIEVSDPADLEALVRTCEIGPAAGGRRVMLCLDDFASEPVREGDRLYCVRSQRDKDKFGDDLAAVNAAMINYLWERLHRDYPDVTLYVVPPYYWSPRGQRYEKGGEEYLRKLGASIPPEVRIVWTGPRVRSLVITKEDVDYYQGLVGRKVMLWDNTIYAHHNPPHYLFDAFTTAYPDRFWELTSSEVHYNAGSSEIYRVGLLCVASYLWNPEGYHAERMLRDALAVVAGREAVDAALAFRDAFYALWDGYYQTLGSGDAFVKRVQAAQQQWLKERELSRIEQMVDALEKALAAVAEKSANGRLVEELRSEAKQFLAYRQAVELMRKLPPPPQAAPENLVPNGDCEKVEDKRLAGWGLYVGAGKATLEASQDNPHSGKYCAALTVTQPHDWGGGHKSINVAAMCAESNGFAAGAAPQVEAGRIYYVGFWLRGDPLPVVITFQGWRQGKES
ncbi:MAG: beta-N-acetylglucosaminidase domain-containing protein, partial [Armatimonadetes bacterium]|nr:beta-N-acetylglucosaminidase domain-containing protein [Armatimonadota bacterium]